MKTAILSVLMFVIMIYPHELGHFLAAKLVGVKVNEFSFGMGPAIWKKQRGETLHTIRIFPAGGFCAMEGEDETSDHPRAFHNKKTWEKLVVLGAGSFMNMLTAVLVMTIVLIIMGFSTTIIDEVVPGMPADKAGIMAGDKILSVGGTQIEVWGDVSAAMQESEGKPIKIELLRDDKREIVELVPELKAETDSLGNEKSSYKVGFTCKINRNPIKALVGGVRSTWNINKAMFLSLKMLFTGEVGLDKVSGPLGMVELVNDASGYGFWYYGFIAALVSVNLGIINLLPLPALDGGRIVFLLFTAITGKKISTTAEGFVHGIGLVLLFGLMIYATMNDIIRIFT